MTIAILENLDRKSDHETERITANLPRKNYTSEKEGPRRAKAKVLVPLSAFPLYFIPTGTPTPQPAITVAN